MVAALIHPFIIVWRAGGRSVVSLSLSLCVWGEEEGRKECRLDAELSLVSAQALELTMVGGGSSAAAAAGRGDGDSHR